MSSADGGERRVLSSSQTFFVKFFGPALIVPAAAYLLLLSLRGRGFPGAFANPWLVMAGGFGYSLWWSFILKRVAVAGDSIYISDYSREVRVPLSAITEVTENRWLKLHPVSIAFDRETPWGSSIKFMPKMRFLAFGWVSHPVVAELRDLAFTARAGGKPGLGLDPPDADGFLARALTDRRRQRV
jgi:hypothetical protein